MGDVTTGVIVDEVLTTQDGANLWAMSKSSEAHSLDDLQIFLDSTNTPIQSGGHSMPYCGSDESSDDEKVSNSSRTSGSSASTIRHAKGSSKLEDEVRFCILIHANFDTYTSAS